MISLLLLGFLIGLRHALEADHIAAIATLSTQTPSLSASAALKQGAAWGLGHTLTLFIFGSIVLLNDTKIAESLALKLELAVGCMLLLLGLDLIRRVIRGRMHIHAHQHANGLHHIHLHSHANQPKHHHPHTSPLLPLKALFIGLMHGMAGSAALIVLTLNTVQTPLLGLLYIALFGIGSMLGMALLSFAIAIPLRRSATGLSRLHNGLQLVIGLATVLLGSQLIFNISQQLAVL